MKVFVTGGTGFVGSALVRSLCARGDVVTGLRRAESPVGRLGELPVRWVEAPLTDEPALARASAGAEVFFHVAADLSYSRRDRGRQFETNVLGTRAVAAAALRVGARRLVHTSSVAAVGIRDGPTLLDESSPYSAAPLDIGYFETKRQAEGEVARAVERGLDAVTVNPSVVLGPGFGRGNSGAIVLAVAKRRIPFVPPGGVNCVGIDDVVSGHLLALERGRRGERYILGSENLTYGALFERIARLAGVRPRGRSVRGGLLLGFVRALRALDRLGLVGRRLRPEALATLGRYLWFDSGKARRELGWTPSPIDAAIRATLEDFRARGVLPPRARDLSEVPRSEPVPGPSPERGQGSLAHRRDL
ncbi:MAG TPA: NAD-dependent epimerase/dehydratase family protein [Planctomycetota bacterium]|jgi:dihydroflavonol-4-reductase|nr:NAD-dependent epimerase/dehydratase family protein [Planctomycetota bacterium]